MEMKYTSGIRKRRKERIKRLRSEHASLRPENPQDSPTARSFSRLQDPEYAWKNGGNPWQHTESAWAVPWVRRLKNSFLMSALLFAVVWGLFQLDLPWAKQTQAWIASALERNLDYTKISAWYERHFQGTPTLLPSFFEAGTKRAQTAQSYGGDFYKPVEEGVVTVFFSTSNSGIRIKSRHHEPVFSLADGWVVYADHSSEVGHTLILRHAEGLETIYSGLGEATVGRGDWVKGGERIGRISAAGGTDAGEWFFAVKKDNRYTDPLEVIALD